MLRGPFIEGTAGRKKCVFESARAARVGRAVANAVGTGAAPWHPGRAGKQNGRWCHKWARGPSERKCGHATGAQEREARKAVGQLPSPKRAVAGGPLGETPECQRTLPRNSVLTQCCHCARKPEYPGIESEFTV